VSPNIGVQSNESIGEPVALSSLHPPESGTFSTTLRIKLIALVAFGPLLPLIVLYFIKSNMVASQEGVNVAAIRARRKPALD
jgi:hypothetical protein